MKEMKTLTINGVTYTVTDPDAASIEDSKVGTAAWSSKNIVDKLCPAFTESGAIVTCEPVEGYPLEVEWETKNLFNDVGFYESNGFTQQADGSWLGAGITKTIFVNTKKKSGIMYLSATAKTDVDTTPFYLIAQYTDGTKSTSLVFRASDEFSTKTMTTDANKTVDSIRWTYGGAGTYYIKDVMVSFTDVNYEPYAETAIITRCGKNLCSLGTQTFTTYKTYTNDVILPAGNYHFSANVETTDTDSTTVSVRFMSMNSGTGLVTKYPVHTSGTINFAFTLSEPTNRVYLYASSSAQASAGDTATYSDIQIVPGSKGSAFEPFSGGTFAPGDTIPALPGINTIFADAGTVTVTGRADPTAVINKLTNAIVALGGNI